MKGGFIIQSNEASMYSLHKEYTGISERKSWPLVGMPIQEDLEKQWMITCLESLNNGNGLTLDAIFDEETLAQYIKLCHEKNIDIRILYVVIAQVTDKILLEIDLNKINMFKDQIDMGYDLIYPEGDDFYYSALNDEREVLGEAGFINRLNSFGVFSELSSLEEYISWRNNNTAPMEVEPISDFVKARVILLQDFSNK